MPISKGFGKSGSPGMAINRPKRDKDIKKPSAKKKSRFALGGLR